MRSAKAVLLCICLSVHRAAAITLAHRCSRLAHCLPRAVREHAGSVISRLGAGAGQAASEYTHSTSLSSTRAGSLSLHVAHEVPNVWYDCSGTCPALSCFRAPCFTRSRKEVACLLTRECGAAHSGRGNFEPRVPVQLRLFGPGHRNQEQVCRIVWFACRAPPRLGMRTIRMPSAAETRHANHSHAERRRDPS
jgi:hypothetical protein